MEAMAGGGETVDGRVYHLSTYLRVLPIRFEGVETRIETRGEPWGRGGGEGKCTYPGDELEVKKSTRNHLRDRNP